MYFLEVLLAFASTEKKSLRKEILVEELFKINKKKMIQTKPHYKILDGLRGVAALVVVWFHIFEAYATSQLDQIVNHGYLAVDFFFALSGFVIGYAYQDRWNKISFKDFFKRRVFRLQPMVIFGSILGASLFFVQEYEAWKTATIAISSLLVAMLMNMFLIPDTPTTEIRGIGEMYPLNGPSWSLFFEYLAYILYGVLLRRFSTKQLGFWVGVMAVAISYFALFGGYGGIGAGWTLTPFEFLGGSLRVLFSFSAGLFVFRIFKPKNVKYTFFISSFILILVTIMPRIGDANTMYLNGLYELFCIFVVFPSLIYFSASETLENKITQKICKFLGDISYPLYLVHYPFIYWYYGWVKTNHLPFSESLPQALALFFGSILLAYLALKLFDEPVRKWLNSKFKLKLR